MAILWPNGSTTRPLVSSGFGPRNLANPLASKYHRGTDFYGFPVVHSVADGEVVFVGWYSAVNWSPIAGFMVWVQHDGFFSRYLHNAAGTQRVNRGDRVKAGDPLISMGWSGLSGPSESHSHVEITPGRWHTANTGQVDPVAFISARITAGVPAGSPEEDDDMPLNDADLKKIDELVNRRVRDAVKELAGPTVWNHQTGENGNKGRNDRPAWERLGRAETAAIEGKQAAQWAKARLGGSVDGLTVDTKLDNLDKG